MQSQSRLLAIHSLTRHFAPDVRAHFELLLFAVPYTHSPAFAPLPTQLPTQRTHRSRDTHPPQSPVLRWVVELSSCQHLPACMWDSDSGDHPVGALVSLPPNTLLISMCDGVFCTPADARTLVRGPGEQGGGASGAVREQWGGGRGDELVRWASGSDTRCASASGGHHSLMRVCASASGGH